MEDYQTGERFWNFLTKEESKATYHNNEEAHVEVGIDAHVCNDFKVITVYEEAEIEDCVDKGFSYNDFGGGVVDEETDNDEVEDDIDTRFRIEDFQDMAAVVEVSRGKPTYHSYAYAVDQNKSGDYCQNFIEATKKGNWSVMEEIGKDHPETLTMQKFHERGTALHLTLRYGKDRVDIAKGLVKLMTVEGLETQDEKQYTPLALAVFFHHDNDLLHCMIDKNQYLLTIGETNSIPVIIASSKGFRDTTEFLYLHSTDKSIFSPRYENPWDQYPVAGRVGINLLNQCIRIKLFGIAKELVQEYPEFLEQRDDQRIYPTHALVKAMAALPTLHIEHKKPSRWNHVLRDDDQADDRVQADELLQLIIRVGDPDSGKEHFHEAMLEAAKHGNIEFIRKMLQVDREFIGANYEDKNMFWQAIMNRQEKVFNLIYGVLEKKDILLSFYLDDKGNPMKAGSAEKYPNILHFVAKLPPSHILDRISGPALQMQREVQWFKAVEDVAKQRYREDLNNSDQTPSALFTETHKELLEKGEKSMKKTATAASTVGGLIVTTMFAAVVAVVAGTYQIQPPGLSPDTKAFFIAFLVLATISLGSCITSILVFLGILASQYSHEDFLSSLPRKFLRGFWFLLGAVTTMMLSFCCSLYIMLKGPTLHYVILLILLLSLVPLFFFKYICPLLWDIYRSTNKCVFDKSTELPKTGQRIVCQHC